LNTLITSLTFCVTIFCALQVSAANSGNPPYGAQETFTQNSALVEVLLLAENSEDSTSDVKSGELIIPGARETSEKEKQCVTVCDTWGENCVINPRTGTRKCRRICKSFGKECI
jgi:hypothetical protein